MHKLFTAAHSSQKYFVLLTSSLLLHTKIEEGTFLINEAFLDLSLEDLMPASNKALSNLA